MEDLSPLYTQRTECLDHVERRLGPRRKCFDLGEIRFRLDEGPPQICFRAGAEHIVDIYLTAHAQEKWRSEHTLLAQWQLAHECVHLVDPRNNSKYGKTNVLEEGLATWWQVQQYGNEEWCDGYYATALALVRPHADSICRAVKEIRNSTGTTIGNISCGQLRANCPEVDIDCIAALTERFKG